MKADSKVSSAGEDRAPAREERELQITLYRGHWARFEGTAAQLEAEGLIPKDLDWPHAATDKSWEVDGVKYSLCRSRPAGHKGPMRSWLQLDHWALRVTIVGRDYFWLQRHDLELREAALRVDRHRLTPAGQRERDDFFLRCVAALEDEKYQAFKAKIPALAPPPARRVRRLAADAV